MVRHGWLDVDGLRHHRLEFGPPDGHPILCIHGVTGTAWVWHGLAAARPDWRLVAVDLRGHGDSAWAPDAAYSTAAHVEHTAAVLDQLHRSDPWDVCGLSWGGLIGLGLAVNHPDLVHRLVMIDIPPSFDVGPDAVPERPRRFDCHAAVVAWERTANQYAAEPDIEAVAGGGVRPDDTGGLVRKHDEVLDRRWPFRAEDHWKALGALEQPLLVVRAVESSVLHPEVAQHMVVTAGDARLVEVERSGHLVPLDAPADLAQHLGAHFSR